MSQYELSITSEREVAPPIQWFLNAEYLAEIDEEYRRRNQKFRAFVNRTIRSNKHPLAFLARKAGPTYDAGHVIPVKTLRRRGTRLERLVVEDRRMNRSKQARNIGRIVNVQGLPVDCNSIAKWLATAPPSYRARLLQFWQDCQNGSNTSRGYYSTDGKVHEFEFVLSFPNVGWVRRTPRVGESLS